MAKHIRNIPEQLVTKLREIEVYLGHGNTVEQACKDLVHVGAQHIETNIDQVDTQ